MNLSEIKDNVKQRIGSRPRTLDGKGKKLLASSLLALTLAGAGVMASPKKADAVELMYKWGPYNYYYVNKKECTEIADHYNKAKTVYGYCTDAYTGGAVISYANPEIAAIEGTFAFAHGVAAHINESVAEQFTEGANGHGAYVSTLDLGFTEIMTFEVEPLK